MEPTSGITVPDIMDWHVRQLETQSSMSGLPLTRKLTSSAHCEPLMASFFGSNLSLSLSPHRLRFPLKLSMPLQHRRRMRQGDHPSMRYTRGAWAEHRH